MLQNIIDAKECEEKDTNHLQNVVSLSSRLSVLCAAGLAKCRQGLIWTTKVQDKDKITFTSWEYFSARAFRIALGLEASSSSISCLALADWSTTPTQYSMSCFLRLQLADHKMDEHVRMRNDLEYIQTISSHTRAQAPSSTEIFPRCVLCRSWSCIKAVVRFNRMLIVSSSARYSLTTATEFVRFLLETDWLARAEIPLNRERSIHVSAETWTIWGFRLGAWIERLPSGDLEEDIEEARHPGPRFGHFSHLVWRTLKYYYIQCRERVLPDCQKWTSDMDFRNLHPSFWFYQADPFLALDDRRNRKNPLLTTK